MAPFGCVPHECYGLYEPFFDHLDDYAARTKDDPEAGARAYLEDYYYGPASWEDYLQKIGAAALLDAARRGRSIYND